MAFAPHPLLDLVGAGRAEGYRFDLLDRYSNVQGTLEVSEASTPTVEHNSNRTVKRTLTGVKLRPAEVLAINPLQDRVRPVMVLGDGTEWPLGEFVFQDLPRARFSYGVEVEASLTDLGLVLDQPCPRNVTVAPSSPVTTMLERFLMEARLVSYVVAASSAKTGSAPMAWKAGTTWTQIVTELGAVAGFYSPAFDHRGVCRIELPRPAADGNDVDVGYVAGERIIEGSILETDDTLDAKNRYVCIDSGGSSDAPIVGVYLVPASAPFSYENRRYYLTATIEVQGVGTAANAAARAQREYLASRRTEGVSFSTPADPRHDIWNVVAYAGNAYREQTWKIACKAGAPMTHELRRYYA